MGIWQRTRSFVYGELVAVAWCILPHQLAGQGVEDPNRSFTLREFGIRLQELQTPIDMKGFKETMPLKEVFGLIHEQLTPRNIDLLILADLKAFGKDGKPDADFYERPVKFANVPKQLSLAKLLRLTASQLSPDATLVIRPSYVEITTTRLAKGRWFSWHNVDR